MSSLHILTVLCLTFMFANAGMISHPISMDNPHPSYEYQYSVHDSMTGDIKDHFEHRSGDFLVGRYSLVDSDGYRRIVDYRSEPIVGFTAQVRREPINFH